MSPTPIHSHTQAFSTRRSRSRAHLHALNYAASTQQARASVFVADGRVACQVGGLAETRPQAATVSPKASLGKASCTHRRAKSAAENRTCRAAGSPGATPSPVGASFMRRGCTEYLKTRMRAGTGPPDPTSVTSRAGASRRRRTEQALLPALNAPHRPPLPVADGCGWPCAAAHGAERAPQGASGSVPLAAPRSSERGDWAHAPGPAKVASADVRRPA